MIVKSQWINEYKHNAIPPKQPAYAAILPQAARYAAKDWDPFIQSTQRIDNPLPAELGDEWDAWMAELPDPNDQYVTDPIVYWFVRQFKYSRLSQMALDTLTIPAMSAECERLFSAAGRLLNSSRSSLDIVIASMCMALRSWLRADNLHDEEVDQTIISVAERVEQDALEQLAYAFREEKAWEVPEKSVLVALVRYRNEIGSGTVNRHLKGIDERSRAACVE